MSGSPTTVRIPGAVALCLAALAVGCERDPSPSFDMEAGKRLFSSYCAPCHHADGLGGQDGAPPLAGSPWLSGPGEWVVRIVLHGFHGPVEVAGKTYNLEMPGFGPVLEDAAVAAVVSYARTLAGAPAPPVSEETVRRVRQETSGRTFYWTAEELIEESP